MPRRQENYEIYLGSLTSKERGLLMRAGASPVWAEPGFLITTRNRRLIAQRFDPAAGKLVGEPVELGDAPPIVGPDGVHMASASRNGILVYSSSRLSNTQVSWYDRAGKRQSVLPLPKGIWEGVSISPDGRRAMIGKPTGADVGDWWLVELEGAVARRFASGIMSAGTVWSPSGDRVAYQVNKSGPSDIYVKSVEGGGAEEPLVVSDVTFKNPQRWTQDGKYVIFDQPSADNGWDVWRVPVAGDRKPEPVLTTSANEHGGWVSPDGRSVAYTSDESGREELYVQSYPVAGQRQQLTTTGVGGSTTVDWSRDGRELILFDADVSATQIATGGAIRASAPRVLFTPPAGILGLEAVATTPDHQRFLVVEPVAESEAAAIEVDLNWAAGVR
jgi:Tol biopolymer transport system component